MSFCLVKKSYCFFFGGIRVSWEFYRTGSTWGRSMSAVTFLAYRILNSSFSDVSSPTSPLVPKLQPPFTTALSGILHIQVLYHVSIYLSIAYLSISFVHALAFDSNIQAFTELIGLFCEQGFWFKP